MHCSKLFRILYCNISMMLWSPSLGYIYAYIYMPHHNLLLLWRAILPTEWRSGHGISIIINCHQHFFGTFGKDSYADSKQKHHQCGFDMWMTLSYYGLMDRKSSVCFWSTSTTYRLHSFKFTLVHKSHSQHSAVAVHYEEHHFLTLYACTQKMETMSWLATSYRPVSILPVVSKVF